MRILSRAVFREIFASALLGTVLFSFVLFLERVSTLFGLLIRTGAPLPTVAYLFALTLPPVLTFTIPIGVLTGVLIGLSRMSGDGEITAMRAAGVPARRVIGPIVAFAFLGFAVATACAVWLTPLAIRETYRTLNKTIAAQLTAEIQPRVFEENFPNTVLYVEEVIPGPRVQWGRVFLADIGDPKDRKGGTSREVSDAPRITLAQKVIAVPDIEDNHIQLRLQNASIYEVGKENGMYFKSSYPTGDQNLDAQKRNEEKPKTYTEMDMGPLWREAKGHVDARIEFHRRLALPLASILLALVAIPLGVSSRKGGRSGAFVLTVALGLGYYAGYLSLIGLAKQKSLPVELAVWLMNGIFAIAGLFFITRLERPGDRDLVGATRAWLQRLWQKFARPARCLASEQQSSTRLPLVSQIIDTYILRRFVYYFVLVLISFVVLFEVFTFFELLGDIVRNQIAMAKVFAYLFFLTPQLIYVCTPLSVLVSVLVTFGLMTKANEVTAFKACGVSLHRLAVPILLASLLLSCGLFAFDYLYVPEANRRQDALRAEIKGKAVQTYLRPDRKWIRGEGGERIYFYKYLDPSDNVMLGVSVYEVDPKTFTLRRHINAKQARWEPALKTWIFQDGWVRQMSGRKEQMTSFENRTATFPELREPPNYFRKEVLQEKQMNFEQLQTYMRELRQSGFDTVPLQVQFHRKFSVPLFALILAMLSIPFAFLTGNRGAMAGVGVSFGIAIAYFTLNSLFEQIGNVNQLPAPLAAWAPDAIFSLTGLYLMTRMRT